MVISAMNRGFIEGVEDLEEDISCNRKPRLSIAVTALAFNTPEGSFDQTIRKYVIDILGVTTNIHMV